MNENYKKKMAFVGESDIAALVAVAPGGPQFIRFGEDGGYEAYIVEEETIPEHYTKVAEFDYWLKIFDDSELTLELKAPKIEIYRAGSFGMIIKAPGYELKKGNIMEV